MTSEDQKSSIIAEAAQVAFQVTAAAAATAKDVMATAVNTAHQVHQNEQDDDDRIARALASALRSVFGENERTGRFIDASRIPLICQNIDGIHTSIKDIQLKLDTKFVTSETFKPYRTALNVIASLVLTAVVGGLLSLIFIKH